MALIFIASIALSHFYSKWLSFPSLQFVIISACIVIISFLSIQQLLLKPSLVPLYKQVKFVFGLTNIFFYSFNFFIFSLLDPFKKNNHIIPEWEFTVLYISNILFYALYIYCLSIDEEKIEREYGIYKF